MEMVFSVMAIIFVSYLTHSDIYRKYAGALSPCGGTRKRLLKSLLAMKSFLMYRHTVRDIHEQDRRSANGQGGVLLNREDISFKLWQLYP